MQLSKLLGGILLVSCTTIGGGVLALPISTFKGGLFAANVTFIICWVFMTYAAFCMLQACLWIEQETNLVSMAGKALGKPGKIIAWSAYLLLLYALISAYLTASSAWMNNEIQTYFGIDLPENVAATCSAIIMSLLILMGTRIVDHFNRFLSFGLIAAYIGLVYIGFPHIDPGASFTGHANAMPAAIPLIITTFGFSIVVPSLTHYLKRDTMALSSIIIIGSLIPLIVYLLWEYIIIGILGPLDGPSGLAALAAQAANGTEIALALQDTIGLAAITTLAKLFSIFAISTSLVGVSLSLFHFLSDGLNLKQQGYSSLLLCIGTFMPPILLMNFFPYGFDSILSFSGIFVSILLGLLPIAMVWIGKYSKKQKVFCDKLFNKPLLSLSLVFFGYIILQELMAL